MNSLIGYTGFIGSNLKNQYKFDDLYNSKNINEIEGKSYDLIVCAGVYSKKWYANKYGDQDLKQIKILCRHLSKTNAHQLILISTISIYDDFIKSNYGMNRFYLEKFLEKIFSNLTIVRLPSLFGIGFKKNSIYDLINNDVSYLPNQASKIQYYYLNNLWKDINIALRNNIQTLNICSEPILFKRIIDLFNFEILDLSKRKIINENMQTKYANLWGNNSNYQYTSMQVIEDLKHYLNSIGYYTKK